MRSNAGTQLRLVCVLGCASFAGMPAEKPGPPYEVRTPEMLQRYQLVAPGKFTFAEMRTRALADWNQIHAGDPGGGLHLVRLSYFTDLNDLNRTVSGKGIDHVTFEYWKLIYDKHGAPVLPAADFIEMNGRAVLRYRSGDKLIAKVVAPPGSEHSLDPLIVRPDAAHGGSYHLLELIAENDGTLLCFAKFLPDPNVEMKETHAGVLAAHLSNMLGIKNVSVYLRKDSWFILQPDFPLAYRFDRSSPPSKKDFEKSMTFFETSAVARGRYEQGHGNAHK